MASGADKRRWTIYVCPACNRVAEPSPGLSKRMFCGCSRAAPEMDRVKVAPVSDPEGS